MANKESILTRFIKYLAPYRFLIILCILLELGMVFSQIFQLHLLRTAIDVYVLRKNLSGLVKNVVLLYLFILCLFSLFRFLQVYFDGYIGQNVMFDLRMKIFSQLQRMSLSFFDKNPIGKLMVVAVNDVKSLEKLTTEGMTNILGNILFCLGITGYLFYQNYKLTLMICLLVSVFGFCVLLINMRIRELTREKRAWFGQISSFLQENITGIYLTKIFCQEKRQSDKLDYLNKKYIDATIHSLFYLKLTLPIAILIRATVICFVLWYGGREVLQGNLSLGSLLVFVASVGLFFKPVRGILQTNRTVQTAIASLERIFKFLDTKVEIEETQSVVKLPEFNRKIEFKNVWFAYDNDNYVLENFNLEIQKGEEIGIVGYTGAGKTSIINLLARFYEIDKGEILIDGINIQNIPKSQLRLLIGLVPQNPFIFSGNVVDNIRLGNLKINSGEVKQAANYVGAHKFINQLPDGYKEDMKEKGAMLSTGQKQLISFARAYVFNPQIIVLDEATANVDAETTTMIKNTLKKLKGKRTSIIIAHHLSTIRDADKIIVLHMGKIREVGTHQELMEKKGIYYTLYELQRVKETLNTIIRSVTKLTEIVGYARLHYVKNAQLARKIGEKLDLSDKQLDDIETAALIYDVGKIYVPDSYNVLTKPDSLTDREMRDIKTHVTYSKKVAEKVENFENIANIVYYHHERWDGKGYIEGLKGEEIPLESRIIAIVDAYQAMIANRPFRKALTLEDAKKELINCAGAQFDPNLVKVFIEILDEEKAKI